MCASPARPAAAARRRAGAGRPGRRSRSGAAGCCRLRCPGWGAVRSFVPCENVVGHALQIVCVSAGLRQRRNRLRVRLGREIAGPVEPEKADVSEFAMSLVASMWLAELLVALGHVEDVVDDLEENSQLSGKTAKGDCLRFSQSLENEDDADAGGNQPAGLQPVQGAQAGGVVLGPDHVDVLTADHAV